MIHSFVNMHSSRGHGTHVQGLYRALSTCAKELGVDRKAFRECIEPGLIALVDVGLYDSRWGNPCRGPARQSAPPGHVVYGEQLVILAKLQHRRAIEVREQYKLKLQVDSEERSREAARDRRADLGS